MGTLWQDIKYGIRMMVRNPGFSFVVLVLVAVGIGVNTTVFTVLNAYLLRPLPYERSDKIVMVQGRDREGQVYGVSYSDYRDWQQQATSFEELSCCSLRDQPVTVTAAYPPDRRSVAYVSGNFFRMFPARPAVGRLLSEEDDRAAAAPAVVIGHAFWQHYFGGAPNAVGRSILLNGVSHAIVGVTRPTFQFPPYGGWARTDLWVAAGPAMGATGRGSPGSCFVVGRLRKGVDIRQAQAEMEAISARLPAEDPSRTVPSATVMRLHDWMTAGNWQLFFVVMGTVLMVFLVTCANVAGLMFARGVAREREMALRSALGAARLRLIRMMLVENVVLAFLGGSLGALGAMWATELLARTDTFLATRIPADFFRPDWRVLGFALALSILAVPIFGLLPSIRCSGVRLARALAAGGRSVLGSRGRNAAHSGLLGAQLAITIVLLVAAALMMRSLVNMVTDDLGFNPKNILVMDIELSGQKYGSPASAMSFYRQLLQRLRAIPGVEKAGLDGGKGGTALCVEGAPAPPTGRAVAADYRAVTPGYFETMQIPLLKGRWFDERDQTGSGAVAIVDQTLAERYWPGGNPIGKRMQLSKSPDPNVSWVEIVGLVGHIKGGNVAQDSRMQVYRPLFQDASRRRGSVLIRTVTDPEGFAAAVRGAVYQIDREQLAWDPRTMEEVLWWRFVTCRAITSFLTVFAGIALCLSAAGIYAITRYSIARRTQELGIRMALGASRNDVLKLVLRKGLMPVLVGTGTGLVGTLAMARVLSSLLYQISPWDPLAYAAVSLLLAAVALLASYLPARRAAKIDPMQALRYE